MSEINDGGPAFPMPIGYAPTAGNGLYNDPFKGMSLRDWFAGQALVGLIAADRIGSPGQFSEDAYKYADAMLRAREAKP